MNLETLVELGWHDSVRFWNLQHGYIISREVFCGRFCHGKPQLKHFNFTCEPGLGCLKVGLCNPGLAVSVHM